MGPRLEVQRCRKCRAANAENRHEDCHKCPDLNGAVMPGCYGGAVYGDIDRCTCEGSGNPLDLEARIQKLEFQVKSLNGFIREHLAKCKALS